MFIFLLFLLLPMEELIEIKTAKITDKGQIAIPKEIRKDSFKEGEKVAILAYTNHMEIRPINQIKNRLNKRRNPNSFI